MVEKIFAVTRGFSPDGTEGEKRAHKHGLAVRIYDLLFTCAEFGTGPSGRRRIGGIQGNSCEGHRVCGESCDRDR